VGTWGDALCWVCPTRHLPHLPQSLAAKDKEAGAWQKDLKKHREDVEECKRLIQVGQGSAGGEDGGGWPMPVAPKSSPFLRANGVQATPPLPHPIPASCSPLPVRTSALTTGSVSSSRPTASAWCRPSGFAARRSRGWDTRWQVGKYPSVVVGSTQASTLAEESAMGILSPAPPCRGLTVSRLPALSRVPAQAAASHTLTPGLDSTAPRCMAWSPAS